MRKVLLSLMSCITAMTMQAEVMRTAFYEDFGSGVFNYSVNGVNGFRGNNNYIGISQGTTFSSPRREYQDLYDRFDRGGKGTYGLMVNTTDFYREYLGTSNLDLVPSRFRKPIYGCDHTKPSSTNSGAFVYVIPANPNLLNKAGKDSCNVRTIYNRQINVSEFGKTNYKASMWISSVGEKDGEFTVKLSAIGDNGAVIGSVTQKAPSLKTKTSGNKELQWRKVEMAFNSWNFQTFKGQTINLTIELLSESQYHYGFCIDDIKLEAGSTYKLLSLDAPMTQINGSREITISSNLVYDELAEYFGNGCRNVYYEWKFKPAESSTFQTFGGGYFGNNMDLLSLRLNAYSLDRIGTWKLIMWNSTKRIEKEIIVNYTMDDVKKPRTRASLDDFEQDLDFATDEESSFTNEQTDSYYTIFDMSGRAVVYSNEHPINIAPLKRGIYILDRNGKQTKFIKK